MAGPALLQLLDAQTGRTGDPAEPRVREVVCSHPGLEHPNLLREVPVAQGFSERKPTLRNTAQRVCFWESVYWWNADPTLGFLDCFVL